MSVTQIRSRAGHPSPRPVGWWGMVTFITSEAVLFAGLIFVYFYLRATAAVWPPAHVPDPELMTSGLRSLLLIASSGPIVVAERALKSGKNKTAITALATTFVMAAIFIVGHVYEQIKLWHEFNFNATAYGSAFYTIVNFHALHLTVGMAMIAFAIAGILRGKFTRTHDLPVHNVGTYWHFVDVVWVVVYATLYLSPHFIGGRL